MMSLIQKYTSRHPQATLDSRWIPGFLQHGEGHGVTVIPQPGYWRKIRRFRKERTRKRISLHKTVGRSRQFECRCWSLRPDRQQPKVNRKQQHHPYSLRAHSPDRQQQLNQVIQQILCVKKQSLRKRARKISCTESSTESATSKTLYEKTDITDAFQSIDLSPLLLDNRFHAGIETMYKPADLFWVDYLAWTIIRLWHR